MASASWATDAGSGVGPLHPDVVDHVGVAAITDRDHQPGDLFPRAAERGLAGLGASGQDGLGGPQSVGGGRVVGQYADVVRRQR